MDIDESTSEKEIELRNHQGQRIQTLGKTTHSLYYRCAIDMLMNEHNRWYSWTYIFLIIIPSIVYLGKRIGTIPEYLLFFICALFSFTWMLVSLNISASTSAWHHTIKTDMEKNSVLHVGLISNQRKRFNNFSRWSAFWSAFGFMRDNNNTDSEKDRESCEILSVWSVTRILIVISLIMTIMFTSMGISYVYSIYDTGRDISLITICVVVGLLVFTGFVLKAFDCKKHFNEAFDATDPLPECWYGRKCNSLFKFINRI